MNQGSSAVTRCPDQQGRRVGAGESLQQMGLEQLDFHMGRKIHASYHIHNQLTQIRDSSDS